MILRHRWPAGWGFAYQCLPIPHDGLLGLYVAPPSCRPAPKNYVVAHIGRRAGATVPCVLAPSRHDVTYRMMIVQVIFAFQDYRPFHIYDGTDIDIRWSMGAVMSA